MIYSLLTVHAQHGEQVSGNWLQDHIGTLETATQRARRTEIGNGSKIIVAVVEQVPGPVAILTYWTDRTRLDV